MNKRIQEICISLESLTKIFGLPEGTFVVGVSERDYQQAVFKIVSDKIDGIRIQLEDGDDLKNLGKAFI